MGKPVTSRYINPRETHFHLLIRQIAQLAVWLSLKMLSIDADSTA